MRTRMTVAALVTLATLAMAQPAAARIVTMTFTGTVLTGVDDQGFFGAAGTDLFNKTFTTIYTLNDEATSAELNLDPVYATFANNAAASGAGDNPITSTVSIGGSSALSFNSLPYAYAAQIHRFAYPDNSFSQLGAFFNDAHATSPDVVVGADVNFYVNHYGASFYGSQDAFSPVDYTLVQGDDGIGQLNIYSYVPGPGTQLYSESISLQIDRVVVAEAAAEVPTGGVPEPTSWTLLISGFAGVGAALRRRRTGLAGA